MAINNIAVPATDSQIHYLKQLAALQFPGSIDNYSTITPIHVLQQQLRSDEDMSLSDAANSGYTLGEGTRFYDNEGNGYDSISKLVMDAIGICSDEEVQKYNIENPERPFVRFEELNNLDNTPVFLRYIDNEEDYVNPYPFSCDGGIKALNKTTDKNAKLSAAQQLYFWTEYKKSNN